VEFQADPWNEPFAAEFPIFCRIIVNCAKMVTALIKNRAGQTRNNKNIKRQKLSLISYVENSDSVSGYCCLSADTPISFTKIQQFSLSELFCRDYWCHWWVIILGIHRHQTPPQYCNAASGSRLKVQPSTHHHMAHYGQTWCHS